MSGAGAAFSRSLRSAQPKTLPGLPPRLLHQLVAKEREYQAILQQVLKEREQEITLLRMRSESAGLSSSCLAASRRSAAASAAGQTR